MKKKFTAILLVILSVSFCAFSGEVKKSTAKQVSVHFMIEKMTLFNAGKDISSPTIKEIYLFENSYWVVNFECGWVLVAADDAMTPVIGYNYIGTFPELDQQDENFRSWMTVYSDQIQFIRQNQVSATEEIKNQWEAYTSDDKKYLPGNRSEVLPLINSNWDQPNPYNLLCPEDAAGPGSHVLVGCVATAMSQIMYYWRYPLQGSGQHSYYQYPYGTITANFGESTYKWEEMQGSIDGNNPWEIAEVSFHTGVSVDMSYGPDASGAYSDDVPYALRTYFKYSNSAQILKKNSYPISSWEDMLQEELNNSHPIYYSGYGTAGGHAFVCDGYQGDNYYHFNFGWSGSQNGYYSLQDVNGFSSDQRMVRYIVPNDAEYPYIADGEYELTASSGSFTDGSGPAENYPAGMNASWLINAQNETDSISSISLEFVRFKTASSDKIKIYDGTSTNDELVGEFSGDELPSAMLIQGNQVLVTFSSSGSDEGFLIEYTGNSPAWCSGTQAFTDPSGTISDGSGTFYYNNQTACMFMITHPEAVKITLEFTEFNTEAGKDILSVYDINSNLLATYSGNDLPDVLEVEASLVLLAWSTNSTVRNEGWSLNYMVDGVGINTNDFYNLSLYPNPTNNLLNLSFDIEKVSPIKIELINMTGQVVLEKNINGFTGQYKTTFDLSNQSKGIYMFSILSDKGKIFKKIMIN